MTLMDAYREKGLAGIAGGSFSCGCGRVHSVKTRKAYAGKNAAGRLISAVDECGVSGRPLVVADERTWAAGGAALYDAFAAAGMKPDKYIIKGKEIHADEHAVGGLLFRMKEDNFLVAAGSGTIGDVTRFSGYISGRDFFIFGTAPSMDGFASSGAPVLIDGVKTTLECKAPMGVFGDTDIMAAAPKNMIAAGLGDMLGKYTAAADWQLGRDLTGEYYCDELAALENAARDKCADTAPRLAGRDPEAINALVEGLMLSGIAIQLTGNSRPASGAEHHISHYLEMMDVIDGSAARLHGDKVGVGFLLICSAYEKFFSKMPEQLPPQSMDAWEKGMRSAYGPLAEDIMQISRGIHPPVPEWEEQKKLLFANWDKYAGIAKELSAVAERGRQLLHDAGGPVSMKELGYTKDRMVNALMYGKEVRTRFTVMRLIERFGMLEKIVEEIADELYE